MCFSAAASFSVASVTTIIGVMTLRRVRSPHEIPLASFPAIFALQQSIEGILWLVLPTSDAAAGVRALTLAYVFVALVVWPTLTPAAVYYVEPNEASKRLLAVCGVAGVAVSVTSLVLLVQNPHVASIVGNSIQYTDGCSCESWSRLPYLAATVAPLLLSSHMPVRALGVLVFVGFLVSAYFYVATFFSVWCFFAAAASLVLLFQFVRGFERSPQLQSR